MAESQGAELSRRTLLGGTIGAGFSAAAATERGTATAAAATLVSAGTPPAGGTPPARGTRPAGTTPQRGATPQGAASGAATGTEAATEAGTGSGSTPAQARSAPMPRIYTRAEWRAAPPRRKAKVLRRPPDHIVVHHTVTPNTADISLAQAFKLSRGVQHHHIRNNKWDDTGQQLTISRGGHVMEGRNQSLAAILGRRHVLGAQTLHHNDHTLGIESEGNYMTQQPPGPLWSSLVRVCAWLCTIYGLDPARALVGHRDYNRTACPGNVLYAQLPMLRKAVALAM